MTQKPLNKDHLFAIVLLILVVGFLWLAIIDSTYREAFADMAKIAVGGFIGWMMPNISSGGNH